MAETKREMNTVDIVDFSMQDNPNKVQSAFTSLIGPKVIEALAQKKQEVAQNMFAQEKVEETE